MVGKSGHERPRTEGAKLLAVTLGGERLSLPREIDDGDGRFLRALGEDLELAADALEAVSFAVEILKTRGAFTAVSTGPSGYGVAAGDLYVLSGNGDGV